jgi:hypothetical protein
MVTERALNNVSCKSMWIWMPIGLLLALVITIRLDNIAPLSKFDFDLGLFLPVWTAFMTYHFGRRALYPLLIALVPVFITIGLKGIGDPSNVFWLSHSVEGALIAVFTAFMFWRSAPLGWMNANLAKHWRWSVSLAFLTLGIASTVYNIPHFSRGISNHLRLDLSLDLGTAAAAIVGATALRHAQLVSYFQRVSPRFGVFLYAFAFSLLILCILVLPIRIDYDTFRVDFRSRTEMHDSWIIGFGGSTHSSYWYTLSFVLVATGAFNLGHILGLTALQSVIGLIVMLAQQYRPFFSDASFNSPWISYLFPGIANIPALLGAITVPYWSTLDARKLTTYRTAILFGVILFLRFVATPLINHSASLYYYEMPMLCGLAFVSGLTWGGRATIAVPIALQLGFLLSSVLSYLSALSYSTIQEVPTWDLTSCARLSAFAFPFAFFGLLARRAERQVSQ